MDNFFIANKLRNIPLVSAGTRADQASRDQAKQDEKLTHLQASGIQLEKRDVASSNGGILFKSAAITASTSNVRSSKQTNSKATTTKWLTTTTTRKPPTTTTFRSTTRRKQAAAAAITTTGRPTTTRQLKSGKRLPVTSEQPAAPQIAEQQQQQQQNSSVKTIGETTSRAAPSEQMASTRPMANSTTTMRKFDRLVSQQFAGSTAEATTRERSRPPQQQTATTAQQLAQVTQPLNQRRTLQPILGPQRFQDGRRQSAGENWVVFNRPDGGYSFFEILVLLASILMVSTIVAVIINNWVRSFRRKRQKLSQQQQTIGGQNGGSRSPSMSTGQPDTSGCGGGDADRKISMISSGVTSLATTNTANTISDAASSSSFSAAPAASGNNKPEATMINMPAAGPSVATAATLPTASQQVEQQANRALDAIQQHTIGVARNISSEIKQAAGNISNKAMAIVQPTENSQHPGGRSKQHPTAASSSAADSLSVMSDPSADKVHHHHHQHQLSSGTDAAAVEGHIVPEKNINRSVSDLSLTGKGARLPMRSVEVPSTGSGDRDKLNGQTTTTTTAALEELFSATAAAGEQASSKKTAISGGSRVGSLDSIELPPTLVESIKRSDGAKVSAPDEAPSPNLLLGERELVVQVENTAASSKAPSTKIVGDQQQLNKQPEIKAASKKEPAASTSALPEVKHKQKQAEKAAVAKPKASSSNTKLPASSDERPGNPMGRDDASNPSSQPPPTKKHEPKPTTAAATAATSAPQPPPPSMSTAEVKNHQVVVNKLDKRKTNLEIVDLRDDSVTGKMKRTGADEPPRSDSSPLGAGNWISMDGVAVVQAAASPTGSPQAQQQQQQQPHQQEPQLESQQPLMSPSEIIESRFRVDYKGNKRRGQLDGANAKTGSKDSADSKATDYLTNNIESELEQDNKMRNRKYFVYIVHDGHFTAKKECIARIELPAKRRITLAEMRQLIASSQDISLTSLRRNRFKFVTETYRLLNENEDATILHQVYPTQGVFLKLNIPEQENQAYAFKGGRASGRLSTSSGGGTGGPMAAASSLSNTTIASRRRAGNPKQSDGLPAIEVDGQYAMGGGRAGNVRASSVQRQRTRQPTQGGSYRRSKSSLVQGRRQQQQSSSMMNGKMAASQDRLPSIGRSRAGSREDAPVKRRAPANRRPQVAPAKRTPAASLGEAASDLGQNVLSGAKKLFNSTFMR